MILFSIWGFTPVQVVVFLSLVVFFIVELIYLFAIYNRVSRYVRSATVGKVSYATDLPSVSVIVYAHAEEAENLPNLLPALLAQDYPCYEVVVVNDAVSFEMQNAIALYECEHNNVYQTSVPDTVYNVSRKKLGITLGVKAAKNDVIVLIESNCKPLGDNWLRSIGRNFVPGVDVVLGYTRMVDKSGNKPSGFKVFDRALFALRYLAYAVIRKPYMGVGSNMAYRKDVFFANKGFSATLNLHYGDDDLLINEIANGRNTRVEIAPESIVESYNDNVNEAWDEMKKKYGFTSKYLRTSSRRVFALEMVVNILFILAFVSSIVLLLPQVIVGDVPAIVAMSVMVLILIVLWLLIWYVYRRAAQVVGESIRPILVPLYMLVRPISELFFSFGEKGRKSSNFTWQQLR
jgi:cellulose synthase/poly-beta-1,6-N-acetylglucosamine synthase-like glycosyltransferase